MRLARTRKEQPTTSNCSLRLAMFTCGACADEIVVQEGRNTAPRARVQITIARAVAVLALGDDVRCCLATARGW